MPLHRQDGKTALDFAKGNNEGDVVRFLEDGGVESASDGSESESSDCLLESGSGGSGGFESESESEPFSW